MTWVERTAGVKVGDQVAYSKQFLQSTGQYTGDAPQARGLVLALQPLGQTTLAVIDWQGADLPGRVNIRNLSQVKDGVVMDRD
jgi:hypothetical protein